MKQIITALVLIATASVAMAQEPLKPEESLASIKETLTPVQGIPHVVYVLMALHATTKSYEWTFITVTDTLEGCRIAATQEPLMGTHALPAEGWKCVRFVHAS